MTGRVPTIRGTAWGNLVAVGEEGGAQQKLK